MTKESENKMTDIFKVDEIVTVQYFELGKNFNSKGEKHKHWEFVYVDKGEMTAQADKEQYVLKQGDGIFHTPETFHKHSANHKTAPNVFIISFVTASPQMEYFGNKIFHVPERLRFLISSMLSEGKNTFEMPFNEVYLTNMRLKSDGVPGGVQMLRTYLEQFLILLLRVGNRVEEPVFFDRANIEGRMAEKITGEIEKNVYGSRITVSDICAMHGYSKAYISRVFKDNTGYTLTEYMSKVKIDEAKRLIRERGMNFTQISDALSFSNPLYFSRVFRRVTGMSPSEYKKSVNLFV